MGTENIKKLFLFLAVFALFSSGIVSVVPAFAQAGNNSSNENSNKVLTGDGPPPKKLGKVGDLYIDSKTNLIFYVKISANEWDGREVVGGGGTGPAGATGATGVTGVTG
ncbi:MAG: PRC-barrel domain-containing protein, partial [Nitrosopumilus sp.]